ncbi:MAG: GNAT family N-acetyltransferase [Anaerolineae bacterium]
MSVTVRPATSQDLEAILELYRQVDDMHLEIASDTYRRPERPIRTPEWIAELIADPQALLVVAEVGGTVVGFLEAALGEAKPLPFLVQKRFVTVNNLMVDAASRRLGVGRALMAAAQDWVRTQGTQELRLTVYDGNPGAMAFYQALGFTPVKHDLRLALDE